MANNATTTNASALLGVVQAGAVALFYSMKRKKYQPLLTEILEAVELVDHVDRVDAYWDQWASQGMEGTLDTQYKYVFKPHIVSAKELAHALTVATNDERRHVQAAMERALIWFEPEDILECLEKEHTRTNDAGLRKRIDEYKKEHGYG